MSKHDRNKTIQQIIKHDRYTGIQSPVRVACLYSTMSGLHLEVLNAEVDQTAEGWKSSFSSDGSGLPEFW